MKYKDFKRALMRKYRSVTEKGVVYFLNDKGGVVATENEKQNLIVMYVYCEPSVVWNHRNVVAIAVAKKFKILQNYETKLADIIAIKGLCGSCNTIDRKYSLILEETVNWEFWSEKRVISTMGEMASPFQAKLDIGIEISIDGSGVSIETSDLNYGILRWYNQPKNHKKAKKAYKVYKHYRNRIGEGMRDGDNFCNIVPVKIEVLE